MVVNVLTEFAHSLQGLAQASSMPTLRSVLEAILDTGICCESDGDNDFIHKGPFFGGGVTQEIVSKRLGEAGPVPLHSAYAAG